MAYESTPLDRELRRNLLLQAATRVYGCKPNEETSMATQTGKAHPGDSIEAWRESALDVSQAGLPALQELRAQTFALARHFSEHPSALPIFVRSRSTPDWEIESRSPASLRAIYDEGREHLRRVLSNSVQSDLLRPLSLDLLTELYLAVLQVSFQDQLRRNNPMDVTACVDQTLSCFLDGMGWRN